MVTIENEAILSLGIHELRPGLRDNQFNITVYFIGADGKKWVAADFNPTSEALALLLTLQTMHAEVCDLSGASWDAVCIAIQRHVLARQDVVATPIPE